VHLGGKHFNLLGQIPYGLGELGILAEEIGQHGSFFCGEQLAFLAGFCEIFAVLGIRLGMRLVAVRLPGLCEQDKRRSVGGLEAEREIKQNKRVNIKLCETADIKKYPNRNNDSLGDEENRCSKEAGKSLGL